MQTSNERKKHFWYLISGCTSLAHLKCMAVDKCIIKQACAQSPLAVALR